MRGMLVCAHVRRAPVDAAAAARGSSKAGRPHAGHRTITNHMAAAPVACARAALGRTRYRYDHRVTYCDIGAAYLHGVDCDTPSVDVYEVQNLCCQAADRDPMAGAKRSESVLDVAANSSKSNVCMCPAPFICCVWFCSVP
jgi:hypothetical protein